MLGKVMNILNLSAWREPVVLPCGIFYSISFKNKETCYDGTLMIEIIPNLKSVFNFEQLAPVHRTV